jgi:hypothetical protein
MEKLELLSKKRQLDAKSVEIDQKRQKTGFLRFSLGRERQFALNVGV